MFNSIGQILFNIIWERDNNYGGNYKRLLYIRGRRISGNRRS